MTVSHTTIEELSDQMGELLAGRGPELQGAILVNLVSAWLAGHVMFADSGDEERTRNETRDLRQEIFSEFIVAVCNVMPLCAEQMGVPHDPIGTPMTRH